MKPLSAIWLVLLLISPCALAQYRCVENGKTVFTDRPCVVENKPEVPVGNAPKIIGDSGNTAYGTPYGDWRGDAQFQARINGAVVQDAHTVGPNSLSLDVTFSGCRFSGYNKRMSGYLNLSPTQRVAMLTLHGFVVAPFGTKAENYDIRATMRR